jgi:hypothetical protein
MRIYSNKHLTVIQRIALWKQTDFPRIGYDKKDTVYKVSDVSENRISFFRTNMYNLPPVGFVAQFVWEYPDRQIGVCKLDLKTYDLCGFDKFYQRAIQLPEGVSHGDLLYVDNNKIMHYKLI